MSLLDHFAAVVAAAREDALSYGEDALRAEYAATANELITKKRLKDAWLKALVVERQEDDVVVTLPEKRWSGDTQTTLAWLAEEGLPAGFDLKPFLLKGKPFVDVPFTKTVGMVEHYVAAVQGGAGGVKAKKALAALKPWVYAADGDGKAALVARGDYQPKVGLAPKIKPYHVADPLHRITRLEATYSQKEGAPTVTQVTGYRFFRRVSEKSAKDSWTYREGITGAHVFEERARSGKDKALGDVAVQKRWGPPIAFLREVVERLQAEMGA